MSRKYAILGETLKHTMSPPIHARLFELKNREYEYEILEVKPEELKDKAEYLNSLNGYNITIPHKIGIIDYTDELDQSAKRYHSVNCVDNKNGRHVGYKTDCYGSQDCSCNEYRLHGKDTAYRLRRSRQNDGN